MLQLCQVTADCMLGSRNWGMAVGMKSSSTMQVHLDVRAVHGLHLQLQVWLDSAVVHVVLYAGMISLCSR